MISEENKRLFLAEIDNLREMDDCEVEEGTWDCRKDYDLYTINIKEISLYLLENTLRNTEPYIPNISDEFAERLSITTKETREQITKNVKNKSIDDYINEMPQRIKDTLGTYATSFATLPKRFSLKTNFEALEIIKTIEYLQQEYPQINSELADQLKGDKAHGTKKSKVDLSLVELKRLLKNICIARINSKDKQKTEKIINKIVRIITSK